MSLVRMHFCTLTARGYGAVSVPTMYGMNGTMPATVNMIDGSEETREALGTTVCSLAAKKSRKRRWISEGRMDVRCPSWNAGNGTRPWGGGGGRHEGRGQGGGGAAGAGEGREGRPGGG